MIVRAVRSIAAAAVLILVLPPAARAQAAAAQPAVTPPPAQTAAQALAQAAPPTFEGRPIKVPARRAQDPRRRSATTTCSFWPTGASC